MLYADSFVHDSGIKIWGSPYAPKFGIWAFELINKEKSKEHWKQIPDDADIVMTHGPPEGILDTDASGDSNGDANLLKEVKDRVQPQYHLFGHVHESNGVEKIGDTVFINAAICNKQKKPV